MSFDHACKRCRTHRSVDRTEEHTTPDPAREYACMHCRAAARTRAARIDTSRPNPTAIPCCANFKRKPHIPLNRAPAFPHSRPHTPVVLEFSHFPPCISQHAQPCIE